MKSSANPKPCEVVPVPPSTESAVQATTPLAIPAKPGRRQGPEARTEAKARKLAASTGVPIEVARRGVQGRRFRSPRYDATEKELATPSEMSQEQHNESLARVAGSFDRALQTATEVAIVGNCMRVVRGKVSVKYSKAEAIAAFMHEMAPRDPGESALLFQAAMLQQLFDKAICAAQNVPTNRGDAFQLYTNQAIRLARTHAGLLQSLQALRAQPGQQRVVVERVNVAPGGVGVGIVEGARGEGKSDDGREI